ncbi:hypothetical protein F5884DRAFT_421743 [Xylogone sp. PMI_703]|nr:hypothetical protein F5884DRAFT_421743 [Xylogone sp. PMI_703]
MEKSQIYHETLSDSEIVQLCYDPNRQIVGGNLHGNLVVKVSEEAVVKFGWGVTSEEVGNQTKVFELLDNNIIRIPKVYRYFTQKRNGHLLPTGFMVMEYIHGEVFESLNNDQINKIAHILSYFSSVHGQDPGPLQRGISHGLLWQDNGKPSFKTVQQMERG